MLPVTTSVADRMLFCSPWKSSQRKAASSFLQGWYGINKKIGGEDEAKSDCFWDDIPPLAVRTETALVIRTGEVSALSGKRGRDQCNCLHFISKLWEKFNNCSVLLCNTQLHDAMPLVLCHSLAVVRFKWKIIIFHLSESWAGLSYIFPQGFMREAESRAQRGG